MEARLSEVQKRLVWLCLASVLLALLIRPQPENGRYVEALAELESFRASFSRKQAEAALQKQAEGRGEFSFARVQEAANALGGPQLKLGEDLSAPRGLSFVRLATLADAHAYAELGASLPVGVADPGVLGQALQRRMAESCSRASTRAADCTFILRGFELVASQVTEGDVARDLRVNELHRAVMAAQAALEPVEQKLEQLEQRVEKRQKRRAGSLGQFVEMRGTARAAFEAKSEELAGARARYESAAAEASASGKRSTGVSRSDTRSLPKAALARLTLEPVEARGSAREQNTDGSAAGEALTFEIPVRLAHRRVSVPVLRGAEFQALRAAGLWDELSGLDAEHAADAIQSHFNWHLRSVELWRVDLTGKKLLQLLPCLLVWLLALLALRMRRAEAFYSPFTTPVPSSLPRVGLKHRWLELLALLVAPLVSIVSACIALWQINQLPILPALSGITCLALGSYSFVKLNDLRKQAISIVRSHSYPPPAHDLSLSP
jgi:hypothetical protein